MLLFTVITIIIMIDRSYDVLHQKQKNKFDEEHRAQPEHAFTPTLSASTDSERSYLYTDGSTVHDLIFRTRPSSKQNERAYIIIGNRTYG